MAEVFSHPQFLANGMAATVEDPELGPTTQVGVPARAARTPGAIQGGQPRAGAHSREVLAEAGYDRGRHRPSARGGDRGGRVVGPLTGVVVLDLGQYLAGPYGPMLLSDLGAEVIKVEPVRGDSMRMAGMPFVGCQRGKLDIAVDVKDPDGLEVVMRLAEIADVVHHNMTKGTAARLGIDYETLAAAQPRPRALQHLRLRRRGTAVGLRWSRSPLPGGVRPGVRGRTGGVGQPAALSPLRDDRYRQRHGIGGGSARRPVPPASYRRGTGPVDVAPERRGRVQLRRVPRRRRARPGPPGLDSNQMGVSPCCRLYETQEGWIQVAAFGPGEWSQLCRLLGVSRIGAVRHVDARVAARAEIESALEPVFLDADGGGLVPCARRRGCRRRGLRRHQRRRGRPPRCRQRAARPGGGVSPTRSSDSCASSAR